MERVKYLQMVSIFAVRADLIPDASTRRKLERAMQAALDDVFDIQEDGVFLTSVTGLHPSEA